MRKMFGFIRASIMLAGATLLAYGSASAGDRVIVATVGNASDAALYIAKDRGYFAKENLDIEYTPIDSLSRMIAPLGQGALDVGSGTAVAGLYNAIERGIGLRIVADRSRMEKGYRFQSLVVRKALIDSGRVKTLADLKGLRVALLSNAGSPASALNEAAKKGGITFDDIEKVILIFPQQVPAFANGAIDASILVEPFTTLVTENGSAAVFSTTEDFVPSDQIGMTIFSEKFAKEKRDLGLRFIRAYVRAARDYNDAIKDGRFGDGPKGAALVKIMADNLKLKEEQVRKVWPAAIDPDARPHLPSLQRSLAFFKEHGFVKDAALQVENVLDMSFVEAAVKDLGPYVNAGD